MGDVKYKFALLDESDAIIHIKDVVRNSGHKYLCPNCELELSPVLGEKKAKHFRHSNDMKCEPDNYLHSVAEETFCYEYKKCLEEKKAFSIKTYNTKNQEEERILTDTYKMLALEERVLTESGFRRPDLLLQSEDGKQLWVEIWVNHKTEERKKREGDILEIKITSNEDICKIQKHILIQQSPDDDGVKLYLKVTIKKMPLPFPLVSYTISVDSGLQLFTRFGPQRYTIKRIPTFLMIDGFVGFYQTTGGALLSFWTN